MPWPVLERESLRPPGLSNFKLKVGCPTLQLVVFYSITITSITISTTLCLTQAYHNRAVSAAAIRWHSRVVRAITISSSSADPKFPEPTQGQDPMIGPGTVAILQLGTKCAYEQYRQHYK